MEPELFDKQHGLRGKLFRAVTGRDGDVSTTAGGDVRDRLVAAFGLTAKGGVNTRAAAQGLGVSQRTVQRWIAPAGRQRSVPSRANTTAITRRARQAASTKAGRRAALASPRTARFKRYGAKLTIVGKQGPIDKIYYRDRTVVLPEVTPDQMQALFDAYEAGGDLGFITQLENDRMFEYVADWQFERIDRIEFE